MRSSFSFRRASVYIAGGNPFRHDALRGFNHTRDAYGWRSISLHLGGGVGLFLLIAPRSGAVSVREATDRG